MSNKKQTSVEWLIEQLTEVERKNWINNKILAISKNSLAKQTFDKICEKAKEIEKEQRGYSEEDVIKIVEKSRETGLTAEYLLLTFKSK
jgi:hypothetical protein